MWGLVSKLLMVVGVFSRPPQICLALSYHFTNLAIGTMCVIVATLALLGGKTTNFTFILLQVLVVITRRQNVGEVRGINIWQVDTVELIPVR